MNEHNLGPIGPPKSIHPFSYHILKPGFRGSLALQNQIFDLWKKIWTHEFGKVGRADDLNPDDFFRQNLITAVTSGEDVVAFHLYTFFDFAWAPAAEHSYFHDLGTATLEILKNDGLTSVMTLEYLSVNPDYRKSKFGIAFGDVMIALGQRVLEHSDCHAAIGTARTDVKVDRSAKDLGFKFYENPIKRYDYECQLVVSARGEARPHSDATHEALINQLWNLRADETNLTLGLKSTANQTSRAA